MAQRKFWLRNDDAPGLVPSKGFDVSEGIVRIVCAGLTGAETLGIEIRLESVGLERWAPYAPCDGQLKFTATGNVLRIADTGQYRLEQKTFAAPIAVMLQEDEDNFDAKIVYNIPVNSCAGDSAGGGITPPFVFGRVDTNTVALSGAGTVASPLVADLRIDPDPSNTITESPAGVLVSTNVSVIATRTINTSGNGQLLSPIEDNVILMPDMGAVLNFLHDPNTINDPAPPATIAYGLGYTIIKQSFTGYFDPISFTSGVNAPPNIWPGQIVKIQFFVNGIYYGQDTRWIETVPGTWQWRGTALGGLFDLDGTDFIEIEVHVRAA